ncbi:ZIP Zinc transporter [Plasmodiophora brassicae]|uniref:Uncharacterized protein n=1 Tax=Plasmodiophora brassicae TaxID=37360 RepID=A0A0G4IU60_PLABS|nr:hypothetical protein PBRA_006788 [Plasmodiophora brassicae]
MCSCCHGQLVVLLVGCAVVFQISGASQCHGHHGHGCGGHGGHDHSHGHDHVVPEKQQDPLLKLYAIIAAITVPLVSFLGMLVIKFTRSSVQKFQPVIVNFGAGTMIGTSLLGFLPEAMHSIPRHDLIGYVVLAGILCAIVLEFAIHSVSKHDHGHAHGDGCKVEAQAPGDAELAKVGVENVEVPGSTTPCDSVKLQSMAWNMLFGDALHSIVDGILVGTMFMTSFASGCMATFVIIMHELPREVAELCILLHVGWPMRKALIRNAASTLTIIIGTVIGITLGHVIDVVANYCLAFVAGEFLYIALGQLMPSMEHSVKPGRMKTLSHVAFLAGIALMGFVSHFHSHDHDH